MAIVKFDFEEGELVCPDPECSSKGRKKLAGGWFARAVVQEGKETNFCIVGQRTMVSCPDCGLAIHSPLFYSSREMCEAVIGHGVIRRLLETWSCSRCAREFFVGPSFFELTEKAKKLKRNFTAVFLEEQKLIEAALERIRKDTPCDVCGGVIFLEDHRNGFSDVFLEG